MSSVAPVAERTWAVTLSPDADGRLAYKAGQFAWLNIGRGVFSLNENPVSISSAPSAGRDVEFIIKELGDFTRRIGRITPGTRAWLEGPHGHLTHEGHEEAPGIALIAGGVGIAPLLGTLRELAATVDPRPTVLLYGNRHEGQIVFGEELRRLSDTQGTELVHVLSKPPASWRGATGLIDAALLRRHFAGAARLALCALRPAAHAPRRRRGPDRPRHSRITDTVGAIRL